MWSLFFSTNDPVILKKKDSSDGKMFLETADVNKNIELGTSDQESRSDKMTRHAFRLM